MLRRFFIALAVLMGVTAQLFAQQTWVPFLQQQKTPPTTTLTTSNNSMVSFTIQINGLTATDRKVAETVYQRLSIPGAEMVMEAGSPQLPVVTKLVALPDCDDITISVNPANELEFTDYNVIPAPRLERKRRDDGSYYSVEVNEENKTIYSTDAYFPGKYAEIIETGYVRGQKVARVAVYPVQFNPVEKTIRAFTDFSISLSFSNATSEVNKELGIFRNMMHHAAINYELSGISASTRMSDIVADAQLKHLAKSATRPSGSVNRVTDLDTLTHPTNPLPVDYLIITHSDLFNSSYLTQLANHRSSSTYNGFDVVIVQVDAAGSNNDIYDFEDTPGHIKYPSTDSTRYVSIRDFIADVYANGTADHTYDGHLGYVLLVGDALDDGGDEMVPANYYYTGLQAGGDYYYACVTKSGDIYDDDLDIMYGRLSVGNSTELNNIVSKIISYEQDSNESWCDDYTFISFSPDLFSSADPDIETMTETIPPTISKSYAYRAYTGATTQVTEADPIFGQTFPAAQYSDGQYNCGVNALKAWLYDNADAGINNGIHTFVYEGHGRPGSLGANEGMGRTIFRADSINYKLDNDLYSFMIFNCCESGWFDKNTSDVNSVDCIAEVAVNISNKGSIGCLASTRDSYSSAFGLVDGYVLEAQYEHMSHFMGEAVMESKLRLSSPLFRRQYNLYGDPALNLWPNSFKITEDLTLSGTHHISTGISVESGATLTIEPGTTLIFDRYCSIVVKAGAEIYAVGTSVAPILFTSSVQERKAWKNLYIYGSNDTLEYCTFEYGDWAVNFYGYPSHASGNVVSNCTFSNNDQGLRIQNSDTEVYDCLIEDNRHAFVIINTDVFLDGNTAQGNDREGIYSLGSTLDLFNNTLDNNGLGNSSPYGIGLYGTSDLSLGGRNWVDHDF